MPCPVPAWCRSIEQQQRHHILILGKYLVQRCRAASYQCIGMIDISRHVTELVVGEDTVRRLVGEVDFLTASACEA